MGRARMGGLLGDRAHTVAFVLANIGFSQAESLVDFGGLFQRITLAVGWGWLTLLAVYLLRTHR